MLAGSTIDHVVGAHAQPDNDQDISTTNAAVLSIFKEIWIVDFEFIANPGAQQEPVCCVVTNYAQRSQFGCGLTNCIRWPQPPGILDPTL
jgi:hypothetical protein